nr:unnamed protein product [Callosobruchus analis]
MRKNGGIAVLAKSNIECTHINSDNTSLVPILQLSSGEQEPGALLIITVTAGKLG